ncbi:hypothetical protein [Pelosinus baikalensis]|uniref:Uncharacterized protein n=1 Tax=Pelosinus baikalensis TaxID=2892015 RepID=A0ABS8HXG3_9FIRM|nr:hypothetical protein [Pelosinus baikalensis]MCC5467856.1 hypothetical protein [Pelosinus baikalensis]
MKGKSINNNNNNSWQGDTMYSIALCQFLRHLIEGLTVVAVYKLTCPCNSIRGWSYNGGIPSQTIKVQPGDYVNIRVYNCRNRPASTGTAWTFQSQ